MYSWKDNMKEFLLPIKISLNKNEHEHTFDNSISRLNETIYASLNSHCLFPPREHSSFENKQRTTKNKQTEHQQTKTKKLYFPGGLFPVAPLSAYKTNNPHALLPSGQ